MKIKLHVEFLSSSLCYVLHRWTTYVKSAHFFEYLLESKFSTLFYVALNLLSFQHFVL